jgi:transposase
MPGGGFHPPYPPEFRAEAVRLVRDGGRTISEVAKGLGVTTESVRLWVKQSDLNAGRRSDGLTSDEREELRQLRRENQRLRQEKEILKRAAAFFAAETNPIR